MSARLLDAVLRSDLHPLGLRMVALVLAWRAHERHGDQVRISHAKLAAEASVEPDHARAMVRALKARGVLAKVEGGGGAHSQVNTYKFSEAWVRSVDSMERPLHRSKDSMERALHGVRDEKPRSEDATCKGKDLKVLSVNAPAVPLDRDRPAGGPIPTATPHRSGANSGRPASANSRIPPGGKRLQGTGSAQRKPPAVPWMASDEATSARGVQMGLGPLGNRTGKEYVEYVRQLLAADKKAGAPWARRMK